MRWLASLKVRIFLACWIVFSIHFATNIVREHYPAFTLIESGSLKLDFYQGWHSDIFVHTDGHSYVGNNVAASYLTALPLLAFDPLLDALEAHSKRKLEESGGKVTSEYRTKYPMRQDLFRKAREAGLDLRLGGSAFVTSCFLMAPLSALVVVMILSILLRRGVPRGRAIGLALLFGFGTPIFFRTGYLNHNMFVMETVFASFCVLWLRSDGEGRVRPGSLFLAGMLAGFGLALDYAGVVPLLCLWGYAFLRARPALGLKEALLESWPFVLGAVPPVAFLCWTQQEMFGDPFRPGQHWMEAVNFTDEGYRGLSWPSPDLLWNNFFHLEWGMFTFGPLLLVAMVPLRWARSAERDQFVLPRSERRFTWAFFWAFVIFCAANQYSRMQFNTGFRYLVPLVPFLWLAACDHLKRLPATWLWALSIPALLHSWVLAMARESVPGSWAMIFEEGVRLPWLGVLKMTRPADDPLFSSWLLPWAVIAVAGVFIWAIWTLGARAERRLVTSDSGLVDQPQGG